MNSQLDNLTGHSGLLAVVPHTLGLGPEVWRILAKAHDTRNLGEYEGDLNVDQRLVTDLVVAVQAVSAAVQQLVVPR